MTTPPILATVTISIAQLRELADAVSELDGLKNYVISIERERIAQHCIDCHNIIEQAAGEHAHLIYGKEPEAA